VGAGWLGRTRANDRSRALLSRKITVPNHGAKFCLTVFVSLRMSLKCAWGFCVRRLNVAAMTASASLCAQLNHFADRLVLNLMREELANVAELEKSRERGTRVPSLKLEGCLPV
jgi:hypothetical protein